MPGSIISPFARYFPPATSSTGFSNADIDTASAADAMKRLAEYIEWPVQYYTGSDVDFYLFQGNQYHKLEEVAACMYNLEEQMMPLRSYADYSSRKIVKGAYIVVGTIAIFYTGYDWLTEQVNTFNDHITNVKRENAASVAQSEEGLFDDLTDAAGEFLHNLNPLTHIDNAWQDGKNWVGNQLYDIGNDIQGFIEDITGDTWGGPERIVDNTWSAVNLNKPRFDLAPFNLLISTGVAKEDSVIGVSAIVKSRLLVGITITSSSTTYANDGQPLVDTYQFIALNEMKLKPAESQQTPDALGNALQQLPNTIDNSVRQGISNGINAVGDTFNTVRDAINPFNIIRSINPFD